MIPEKSRPRNAAIERSVAKVPGLSKSSGGQVSRQGAGKVVSVGVSPKGDVPPTRHYVWWGSVPTTPHYFFDTTF